MDGWDWMGGLDGILLRSLVQLEHLAVLITQEYIKVGEGVKTLS